MYIVLYSGVYSYFDWILYFEGRTSHPSLVSLLLLIQYALFLIRKKQKQKQKKQKNPIRHCWTYRKGHDRDNYKNSTAITEHDHQSSEFNNVKNHKKSIHATLISPVNWKKAFKPDKPCQWAYQKNLVEKHNSDFQKITTLELSWKGSNIRINKIQIHSYLISKVSSNPQEYAGLLHTRKLLSIREKKKP